MRILAIPTALAFTCLTLRVSANDGYELYGITASNAGTAAIVRIDQTSGAATVAFELFVPEGYNVGAMTYHAPSGLLAAELANPDGSPPRILFVNPDAGIADSAPITGLPEMTFVAGFAYDTNEDRLLLGLHTFGRALEFRVADVGLDGGVIQISDELGVDDIDQLVFSSATGELLGCDMNGNGDIPRVIAFDDVFGAPVWSEFASPPYHGGIGDVAIHPANERFLMIRFDATGDALTELIDDMYVDVGMFEIVGSVNGIAFVPQVCPADLDGCGNVGIDDLLVLLQAWGTNDPVADIAPNGGDGIVNVEDLLFLIGQWGPCG